MTAIRVWSTPGHCLQGTPTPIVGNFVVPAGPPTGGTPNGPSYALASSKSLSKAAPGEHDIACVFLTAPVPKSVVASYPRVYTGGIKYAVDSYKIVFPGYIAGFGSFVTSLTQQSTLADGNRRWGDAPHTLKLIYDKCGDVGEQHCFDDWIWDGHRNANPQPERGDSGGPLLLSSATGPVIVGVYSGFWYDSWPHDTSKHSSWAATGNPGGTNNGLWIVNNCLGGDADSDGVPDAVDNCPPSRCANNASLDPTDCDNPDQFDWDLDGVGEACDNCSKAVCDSMAAAGGTPYHVRCFNPGQGNLDGDSRGDACDLCPNSTAGDPPSPSFVQSDVDHDGVGDACDFCEKPNHYDECVSSLDCTGSVCLIDPGEAVGYCALPTDSDLDGIVDACDLCPNFQSSLQSNANRIAEEREKQASPTVQNLADACDPVPIVRLESQKPIQIPFGTNGGYVPGDGLGPDDVADLGQNGWLGVDITDQTPKSVQRPVAYRHCSCVINGAPVGLEACTAPSGPCSIANPLVSTSDWKLITLTEGGAPYVDGAGLTTTPKGFTTSQLSAGVPKTVQWWWRADVGAGKVPGLGNCPGSTVLECRTHGAIFTRTLKVAPFASNREKLNILGDVFAMIDTPALKAVAPKLPLLCPVPCIPNYWGWPDYLRDPDPFGFTGLIAKPTPLLIDPTGSVFAATTPGAGLDVTSYFDDGALSLLQSAPLWLGAVEPIAVARDSTSATVRSGVHAVAMERQLTGRAPVGVTMTSGGVSVTGRAATDDVVAIASTSQAQPPALEDFRAAFSAVEGSVYVVGGRLADGTAAQSLWRWDMDARSWSLQRASPPVPSSNVLSVGYTPDGQHLYVLDVDDNDAIGPNLRFARLYRIDLALATSTTLLRVPYLGKSFAAIAVMPDGMLALVSSGGTSHMVWRIDGRGQSAKFKGVAAGKGAVRAAPVMGEDRLYIAVEAGAGKLDVVDLAAERFHGGPPCNSL